MITDTEARRIASEWHGGQWSPLYSLSSCGAIADSKATLKEIEECMDAAEMFGDLRDLAALFEYVKTNGPRGVQPEWHTLRF